MKNYYKELYKKIVSDELDLTDAWKLVFHFVHDIELAEQNDCTLDINDKTSSSEMVRLFRLAQEIVKSRGLQQ